METFKDSPKHTGVNHPQRNKLGIRHNPKNQRRDVEGSEQKQQHSLLCEWETDARLFEGQRYKRKFQRALEKAGQRPDPPVPRPGRVTSVLTGKLVGVTPSRLKLDCRPAGRCPPQVTHVVGMTEGADRDPDPGRMYQVLCMAFF